MEITEANELIIREALLRLGPKSGLDLTLLQSKIAEVVKERGEAIFGQLSKDARQELRNEGLRLNEGVAHLERINEAIEYGRSLIAKYRIETLGELPQQEQQEFARRYVSATGGAQSNEN